VLAENHTALIQVNRGEASQVRMTAPAEPMRTVAGHGEWGIVSMRNHGDVTPGGAPTPTVCGGGYHHGMLVYNGVPGFVRTVADAAGTVTGRDKQSLLTPASVVPAEALTDDELAGWTFRMLQWHELLRAQHMHEHQDGRPYQLTARRRDERTGKVKELSNEQRVKMIGNAVSSPVATMLGTAVAEVLAGKDLLADVAVRPRSLQRELFAA
jgi:site-specific DNA-cytosine methylase